MSSLEAAAIEMFEAFKRTAMSTIISETLDLATGITDKDGGLACAGIGLPIFIGSLSKSVKVILDRFKNRIFDGDIFMVNDPYNGGVTHLNDHVIMIPLFVDGELIAWVGNMAHQSDIGGMAPGSASPNMTEIFHEGLIVPPLKIYNKGILNEAVIDIQKANSRLPAFLEGDLKAGIAAAKIGKDRVLQIISKYGKQAFFNSLENSNRYGEQLTLAGLKKLKKGTFKASEV